MTKKVYSATCDQFDDSTTGYHFSPELATLAFWAENVFTDSERKTISVYVTEESADDDETISNAIWRELEGSPSPALVDEIKAEKKRREDSESSHIVATLNHNES